MVVYILILLFIHQVSGTFTPNRNKNDAYGIKISINNILLVQVHNEHNPPTFLVQFAPYNDSSSSFQCSVSYPNAIDHYVYTVAIGKNETQFFFAGEMIDDKNGTFIGVAKYNSSSSTCDTSFSFFLQYFYNYEHQEYYLIDVEPTGRFAYGFSNQFIFIFDSQNTSTLNLWNGNVTWPDDSFMPHAIDLADNFGVITGFIRNPIDATVVCIPMIYLINYNSSNGHPFIIDQYQPIPTPSTWQDLLTNSDADMYSAKYDMSVSINKVGNVLVGMQFINRVFLFSVNSTKPNKLIYISRNTNGRSIGNGKSVAWLENGIAAVLINKYSLEYQWSSSEIYFYDIETSGYNSNSVPLSVFPNYHQILPLSFSPIFQNIISSPSSLALLDDQGNILIFNPTPSGFFPYIEDTGSIPIFTSPQACLPGTYKNRTGVYDCILCPSGTKNPGNSSLQCTSCLSGSFCPLGSVDDVSQSALETIGQVIAYPKSPKNTKFGDVLIRNTFHMKSCHSLLVSPSFWATIVAGVAFIAFFIVFISDICIDRERSTAIRTRTIHIFEHIDIIGAGEYWIGGLASFAVIVMVSFAFYFSYHYLQQYPIEKASDSYFACDLSLRNAKFETNLQSLSIPGTRAERQMFDLLNNQTFNLNVDFVNTLINCDSISLQALFGTKWSTIRWLTCANTNSILSLSIPLPFQHITVQVLLDDVKTVGGLRMGLSANGSETEGFNCKELNFFQSFFKSGQILAQHLPISLDITKVINETLPMNGRVSDYSGIYIPTFSVDLDGLFLTQDQYVRSTSRLTILTVVVSETAYYVKNLQQPIAKRVEIIFDNLLFTTLLLGLFSLMIIMYKLCLKLYHRFYPPVNVIPTLVEKEKCRKVERSKGKNVEIKIDKTRM